MKFVPSVPWLLAIVLWIFPVFASAQTLLSLNTEQATLDPNVSADEKALVVLEPRPFSKTGRAEMSLGLGTIASDIFLVYLPVTLRGAYHFKEWVSLELSASYMGCFSQDVGRDGLRASNQGCMRLVTPTYDRLMENSDLDLRSLQIKEYTVARFSLGPVFSPIMGKFALVGSHIAHFDVNLAAGLGVQLVEIPDAIQFEQLHIKASFEGSLGLGLRFVFLDFVGVRLDFRQYLFGKQNDKGLGTASELSLSVSFLL